MDPRSATAVWKGSGKEGSGTLSTLSGALTQQAYSFDTRFKSLDGKAGVNPEELIAAAHAACYSMALAFAVSKAGAEAQELTCRAELSLAQAEGRFSIGGIRLVVVGKVAGMDAAKFAQIAEAAKIDCPVSRALAAVPMTLELKLG